MSDKNYLGYNVERLETAPAFLPYSKVIAWYDDENAFVAGDDSGRVLTVDLPFATQAIVDKMLERIKGYSYQPWTGSGAILDPAAELGDGVTVNGVYSVLASAETSFDALMVSDAAAPADEEVDHEYPYVPPTDRALKRKVTLGADYFGSRITRKSGLQIVKHDADGREIKRATFNADVLEMCDEDGTPCVYFDTEEKKFRFVGDLDVSGGVLSAVEIRSSSIYGTDIYGGRIFAIGEEDEYYAQMLENSFALMGTGSSIPRAALTADVNMVELSLGVGDENANGRFFVRKSYGSVNGSSTQNFGLIQYHNVNGGDAGLALLDDGSVNLFAAPGGGFNLFGNSCKVYSDDNGIVFDAGPVVVRVDNNNQSVNFYFEYDSDMNTVEKTVIINSNGVRTL